MRPTFGIILAALIAAGFPLGWYSVHADDADKALAELEKLHAPGKTILLPPAPKNEPDHYWIAPLYVPNRGGDAAWAERTAKFMNDCAANGWDYKEQLAPGYFLFATKGTKR